MQLCNTDDKGFSCVPMWTSVESHYAGIRRERLTDFVRVTTAQVQILYLLVWIVNR